MARGHLPRKLRAVLDGVRGSTAGGAKPFRELRVLDLACGVGQHLAHLSPESLGLDRDPGALEAARTRGLRVERVDLMEPGWGARLTARWGPFEGAYLADCLVHLEQPGAALLELAQALGRGAPVLIAEWVLPEPSEPAWLEALARAQPGARAHWSHPEHLHHWPESRWWQCVLAAGYRREGRILHSLPQSLRERPLLERAAARVLAPRTLVARAP